ncbi:MAG: porin [Candidatus Symbiobacter sp.]|nr:porin [Candidatus Symbiobacter sp.]
MRVQWLSSAALLALIAAPGAFAQQVTTSEPFTLKLSGHAKSAVQFVQPSNELKGTAGTSSADTLNTVVMATKARVNIAVDAMVGDIGYGGLATLDFQSGAVNLGGPNTYIYVSPMGAGKIGLGVQGYSSDMGSFDNGKTWGTGFGPDGDWGTNATGYGKFTAVMADIIDGTGNFASGGFWDQGNKITYTTPNLAGFSAQVGYLPSDTTKSWGGGLSKNRDGGPNGKGNSNFNNVFEVGAGYTSPDMGGVMVNVGGAFLSGTASLVGNQAAYNNLSAFQAGVGVTGYGVMAQFTFVSEGKSGTPKMAADSGDAFTAVSGWSTSLAYAMGPAQFGVYYGMAKQNHYNAANSVSPIGYLTAANNTVFEVIGPNSDNSGPETTKGSSNTVADWTAMGVGASYNVSKGAQAFLGYESFSGKAKGGGDKETAGAVTLGMIVSF